ncbi:MAG TPA: methylaspartate ammonia-lyase, partial [Firmicutes bacterium]|nr:methylaspartate ammonia-lyase [Bacillota bacterium]
MRIKDVVLSKGLTGFYFDDQKAIRQGDYVENGLGYDGEPMTPGFTKIRQ